METVRAPDVVLTLEAGADDYVTKPIGVAELRSRVRAVMRRVGPPENAARILRHGALRMDPATRVVTVGDVPVPLTSSELEVLRALLGADGGLLSRAEILRAMFGDDAFRDLRTVDVHVHHLREKLRAGGGDPDAILTVRGAGYRLASGP